MIAAVVDAELAHQRDRESSVRQRGALIVTAAGGLVTLILAVGGARSSTPKAGSPMSGGLFDAGLMLFVLAAALGLLVNAPWSRRYWAWLSRGWARRSRDWQWPGRYRQWLRWRRERRRSKDRPAAGEDYSEWVQTLTAADRQGVFTLERAITAEKAELMLMLRRKNDGRALVLAFSILAIVVATTCFALATVRV